MTETGLVSLIRKLAGRGSQSVIEGIGDDCAVLRPNEGHDLVFTTDFTLEGRHFTTESHQPSDIGHKALARSLSDIAAMGGRPLFCLVSLAMPAATEEGFVEEFYRGLLELAARHSVALAGGDLASFDALTVDVMCCGEVPTGSAMLRRNARVGDLIYVSGTLGGSAHGFRSQQGANFQRHLRPEPRVQLGRTLREAGVTCCMDLSDGLALDLTRLCRESEVSAEIEGPLPIADGASEQDALSGGEDYELLFTAPPGVRVPEMVEGVPVTRIGIITAKGEAPVLYRGQPLATSGFDHFFVDADGERV